MLENKLSTYSPEIVSFLKENGLPVLLTAEGSTSLTIRVGGDTILTPCKPEMSHKEFVEAYKTVIENLKGKITSFCNETKEIVLSETYQCDNGDIDFTFKNACCITSDNLKGPNFFDFKAESRTDQISEEIVEKLASWLKEHGYEKSTTPATKVEKAAYIRETEDGGCSEPFAILHFSKEPFDRVILYCYPNGTEIEVYNSKTCWQDTEIDKGSSLVCIDDAVIILEPSERETIMNSGFVLKAVNPDE